MRDNIGKRTPEIPWEATAYRYTGITDFLDTPPIAMKIVYMPPKCSLKSNSLHYEWIIEGSTILINNKW